MSATTPVNNALKLLLEKYAKLDMFDGFEISSPDSRGPAGDTPFHMVAYDGDVEAAKVMLPYTAEINLEGDIGNTPLHYAVMNNKLEMARFLIKNGADVNRKNDYGDTPRDLMEGKEVFEGFDEE